MKTVPFLISTIVCALCFVLGIVYFFNAGSNRSLKREFVKLQADNQTLQQEVKKQDETAQDQQKVYNVTLGIAQLKQGDLQRMQQTIETGGTVAQKLGPQILSSIGYLAAKHDNKELRKILARQKWEAFIPNEEALKKIDEQLSKNQSGQNTVPSAPSNPPRTGPAPH